MTPKEKSKYLVELMQWEGEGKEDKCFKDFAKECALIAVNERLNELNFTHIGYGKYVMQGYKKTKIKYWQEVKKEILIL